MSASAWLSRLSFRWRVALDSVFLFALNAFVCRELFAAEYLSYMGSIEAAFISLARYIRDPPGRLGTGRIVGRSRAGWPVALAGNIATRK